MSGPVTPEARTMGPPGATCAQCRRFDSFPGDETAGRCLNQPWDHAQHGTIYGLAFAREGADGCDGYAPREGAPPAIPDLRPDPDAEDDVAASRDRLPPQPVAERVNATETGGTEAPGETVVASSCGACSAMREALARCEREMQWAAAHLPVLPDEFAEAMHSARALSSGVLR